MSYMPWIEGGWVVVRRELGGYRAVLLTEPESPGGITYAHVLLVTATDTGDVVLAVASEKMSVAGPGSHVLGLFPGDSHVNLGARDEWADLETFREKALLVAAEHLGLSGTWR